MITSRVDPCDGRSKILAFKEDTQEIRLFARDTIHRLEATLTARIGEANVAALRAVLDLDWGRVVERADDPDFVNIPGPNS